MMASATDSRTAALAEQVRAASANDERLRIVGRGHWLSAGAPCAAHARLELGGLSGIVEYRPGDLTLTALAGTALAELEHATAQEGQWLPFDPFGAPDGTLGATVATASSGPLSSSVGTPRDQVLGCEFITGSGAVVRAGGRVVKNVAGFDLTRLVTGAWGTLGAITELSVRLRARPAAERTFAVAVDDDGAERAWRWLRDTPTMPMAAELLSASLARRLDVGQGNALLLRFGGNVKFVTAASDALPALGRAAEVADAVWAMLRVAEPDDAAVVRFSTLPSRAAGLWRTIADDVERRGGFAHATLTRGVVRCVMPAGDHVSLSTWLERLPGAGTRVAERLPAPHWAAWRPPTADAALSAGVRRAFDPARTLNPGILGAGA